MSRTPKIARRKRYFIGCEGESEQGYIALLQRFSNDAGLAVHLDAKVITSAGDPLAIVERAVAIMKMQERGPKPDFVERFVILDADLLGQNPVRDKKVPHEARQAGLKLVWQDTCFESFILRHFDGHENDRPATSALAMQKLVAVWPEYSKGMPAQKLAKKVSLENARNAAKNPLNSDFGRLFSALGLIGATGS